MFRWSPFSLPKESDVLGAREGHVSAVLTMPNRTPEAVGATASNSNSNESATMLHTIVVIGGYVEGELGAAPVGISGTIETWRHAADAAAQNMFNAPCFEGEETHPGDTVSHTNVLPVSFGWRTIGKEDQEYERDGATLVAFNNSRVGSSPSFLLLFGGMTSEYECDNKLFIVEAKTTSAAAAATVVDNVEVALTDITSRCSGTVPQPRYKHSACALGTEEESGAKKMAIFGGYADNNEQLNELHLFDVETRVWQQVQLDTGLSLEPRLLAAMAWIPSPTQPRQAESCSAGNEEALGAIVLYGGSTYAAEEGQEGNGDMRSLSAMHKLSLQSVHDETVQVRGTISLLEQHDDQTMLLPRCNGHVAFSTDASGGCVFVGGKDRATGFDGLVHVGANASSVSLLSPPNCDEDGTLPTINESLPLQRTLSGGPVGDVDDLEGVRLPGVPHWRYTASGATIVIPHVSVGTMTGGGDARRQLHVLIAGHCRHSDNVGCYLLEEL